MELLLVRPLGATYIQHRILQRVLAINEDDTVIVLEAMKMETTIKTPINGIIKKIFVENGDKVQAGDPLFEVVS